MGYKEQFTEIYQANITRQGSQELFDWISTTDFFTAPASTRFHCACLGGLVQHSVKVYEVMMEKHFDEQTDNRESFAICALLHDLCKAQFYKTSTRNVKNEATGAWERQPYYTVEDSFPYGHGEKSVFLIERFMRLKTSEAMAIRWHMGGFDDAARGGSFAISLAFDKYPIAVKLHLADLESTYLREKGTSAVNKK
ncbi:MAG TPA: hydrolase [Candidatus Gallacutalibacter stercoravium]|nr:hydrolase [Candidatus Gallacutalibacter stercoravium]